MTQSTERANTRKSLNILSIMLIMVFCGCDGELLLPCASDSECPGTSICLDQSCAPANGVSIDGEGRRCVDSDGDGYGSGPGCLGVDCDDWDAEQGGEEVCDGRDNDCDGEVDEGTVSACGECNASCLTDSHGVRTEEPFDADTDDVDGLGTDAEGALVLDSERVSSNHIWIANSGEGTISKFNTETYEELGRYSTGPSGRGNDPSRTSVNSRGDVYVGNRGGSSVTRISTLGAGCPDTNGDGVVTTSTDGAEVLQWGQDDCVLWHTDLRSHSPSGRRIRAVAAQDIEGPDGELYEYVWIGSWDDNRIFKLDGRTGEVLLHTESPVRPYGFALDQVGNLWISTRQGNNIARLDTNLCRDTDSCAVSACHGEGDCDEAVVQVISVPVMPYGITVDFNQRVWMGGGDVVRYDPTAPPGSRIQEAHIPWARSGIAIHGIAADASGFIWGAGQGQGIIRVDADTMQHVVIEGSQGQSNKGMAVDGEGKIWSITQRNRALVVTPGAGLMDYTLESEVAQSIVSPYTYSDMTGVQLRLATNPRGYYRRVYEACLEDPTFTPEWRDLIWSADIPVGTRLAFRVRTADSRAELAAAEWIGLAGAPGDESPVSIREALATAGSMPGKYLELEVVLQAERLSTSEIITPRLRWLEVGHLCRTPLI